MHRVPGRRLWVFSIGCLLVVGCGASGPKMYPISGTVTWESEPLSAGDITFTPVDEHIVPVAGKIVDGGYRLEAPAGAMKVAIFAIRPIGPPQPEMGAQPHEMYIPVRYNHETTLTATVEAQGKNHFEYELTVEE